MDISSLIALIIVTLLCLAWMGPLGLVVAFFVLLYAVARG